MTTDCPEPITYDTRFCAFIDILGFRSLVEASARDYSILAFLHSTLSLVVTSLPEANNVVLLRSARRRFRFGSHPKWDAAWERASRRLERRLRGTAFSDSVVLSAPDDWDELGWLLATLEDLVHTMLRNGVLVRGGIAYGELVHSTSLVFGPALVDAYLLESKEAVVPRVVVSDRAFERMAETWHTQMEEMPGAFDPSYLERMFRLDADGKRHLEFLGDMSCHTAAEIRNSIVSGMGRAAIPSSCVKWNWIANYYNARAADHVAHACIASIEEVDSR
jgi:hypothetical protein